MDQGRRRFLRTASLGVVSAVGIRRSPGVVSGSEITIVTPKPPAPHLPAQHHIRFNVDDLKPLVGKPLRRLTIDYGVDGSFDGDASNVDTDTVVSADIWERKPNEDYVSSLVADITSSVSVATADAESVTFEFNGERTLAELQYMNVSYHGVKNPSVGWYQPRVSLNDGEVTVAPSLNVSRKSGVLPGATTVTDGTATVRSAYLRDGGFVVIATKGDRPESLGHSSYLEPGGHTDVAVPLYGTIPTRGATIVVFRDRTGTKTFDPKTDIPYMRYGNFPASGYVDTLSSDGDLSGTRKPLPTLGAARRDELNVSSITPRTATGTNSSQSTRQTTPSRAPADKPTATATTEATPEATATPSRGFFSNDPAAEPSAVEALSDPQFLTVGGFVFSVVGMLHQLVKGR